MNPIRTNKPVFFGDDGEVLKSGRIYIGQPNQWPLSFPKTVTLQDSAGSQFTAQQPLVTNNQGRIEYNGKAVIALVGGNYSMLVRDRNGVTVADGYTPFVSAVDAGASGAGTQVGTLLVDIKQLNVTPGQTVRNVGKVTALDRMGADWLVVSNTGSAGDDEALIDFNNGAQGRRLYNNSYPAGARRVWSGDLQAVPYGDLSESGPGFYVIENATHRGLIHLVDTSLSAGVAVREAAGDTEFVFFNAPSQTFLSQRGATDLFIKAIYKV